MHQLTKTDFIQYIMALDIWGRMVSDPNFKGDRDTNRKNLLAYCKLDTLAMVEIYKVLY